MNSADENPGEEQLPTSLPEVDALLAKLEEEESDLSLRRRRLFDRIDRSPESAADWLLQQEREVSDERRRVHARIDAVRAHRDTLSGGG